MEPHWIQKEISQSYNGPYKLLFLKKQNKKKVKKKKEDVFQIALKDEENSLLLLS